LETTRQAFETIVTEHQARVFSIAFRILGDYGAAEEVAQDVFLECHRALPTLTGPDHLTAWLRRVACHRATDALRRRAARGGQYFEVFDETLMPSCEIPPPDSPLMNRIEQLLCTLPEQQRAVLLLRYQEDLDPPQIAETLAMPLATVRSHLQRAIKLLRSKAERTLKEYTRG
jgi:RNA polymerase sigma-70 factor (ECF subfamily)